MRQDARKLQPVTIHGPSRPDGEDVQGFVYGMWAVTPDPDRPKLYRVTHVPTGFSATMYEAYPLTVARKIARRYREELDDDFWSTADGVPAEVPPAEERKVRRILSEADEERARIETPAMTEDR